MSRYSKEWLRSRKDATLRKLIKQLSESSPQDEERLQQLFDEQKRRNTYVNTSRLPDERLEEERQEAFDKWTWETGSDEDRKIFEQLEEEKSIREDLKDWRKRVFEGLKMNLDEDES